MPFETFIAALRFARPHRHPARSRCGCSGYRSRWHIGERLCKVETILFRDGSDGTSTSALLRRRGRGRQPDPGRAKTAAYRATVAEPADPRSRTRARGAVVEPGTARGGADRGRARIPRSRAGGAIAGRGGRRSRAAGGATGADVVRARLPHRLRDGLAAGRDGLAARGTALGRGHDPQPGLRRISRPASCAARSIWPFCARRNRRPG